MQQSGAQNQAMGTTYRMRAARARWLDISTRRLLLAGGFLVCAVVLGVSIYSIFNGQRSGVAPVIEAARGPLRVRPDNPGGLRVAGQNDSIMSTEGSARGGTLAPPPEDPAVQRLRAQQRAALEAVNTPAVAPPVTQVVAPVPQLGGAAPAQGRQPVTSPNAAPPSILAIAPSAAPVALTAPAGASPAAAPGKKQVQAQLAAVGSEQAAKAEWQRLSKHMPDVLGGRQPVVVKAERDGRAVWRLRTGGFADPTQASAFCAKVKAKGVSCAVAVF